MSVDDRLRRGLEAEATSFHPEVEARLAALHRRHGRRRAVLAAALTTVVILGAGLGAGWLFVGGDRGTGADVQPVAPASPSRTMPDAGPDAGPGARIPDSAWERTVTRRQAMALGLGRDFLRDNFGEADEVPVVLSFFGEAYSQSGRFAGRWQVGDAGGVSYEGDVLVLTSTSPGCVGCVARLAWTVSGDVLRLSDPRGTLEPDGRLMLLGRWSRQTP